MLAKCWPCFILSLYTLFWTFVCYVLPIVCACTYVNVFLCSFCSIEYNRPYILFLNILQLFESIHEFFPIKMGGNENKKWIMIYCFMHLCLDAFCMCAFAFVKTSTDESVCLVAVCNRAWLSNETSHVSVYTCMLY